MTILKFILSKPYWLFTIILLCYAYYFYSNIGLKAINAVILVIFYFPFMRWIFSLIKYRLVNLFITTPIDLKVIEGYMFIFTFFFPLFAIPLAIISKLFKINENKKFLYTNNHGDTISGIRSGNPTIVLKRDKGNEEETIVMTKYTRKKR